MILPSKYGLVNFCFDSLIIISDPFQHMARANKTYGFTIAVKELKETVPNIFRYASAYKRKNKIESQGLWEMFIEPKEEQPKSLPKDDPKYRAPLPEDILNTEPGHGRLPDIDPDAMEGETYNMCHFWSNFEIARLDWFRSREYEEFFEMMDRSGGFWMERVSCSTVLKNDETDFVLVGGCTHSLFSCGGTLGSKRYPLLPGFWVSTYDNSALSSKRASAAVAPATVSREDN